MEAPVTLFWVLGIAAVKTIISLGLIKSGDIALVWPNIYEKHEFWRIITCVFHASGMSTSLLIGMIRMKFVMALEKEVYGRHRAVFVFHCTIVVAIVVLLSMLARSMVYVADVLMTALMYIWSKVLSSHRDNVVFFVEIPAQFMPFIWILYSIVFGGHRGPEELMGVIAGHIGFTLFFTLPIARGRPIIVVPNMLKNLL